MKPHLSCGGRVWVSSDSWGGPPLALQPRRERETNDAGSGPSVLVEQLGEANDNFRAALMANARQAIERGFGVELPADWTAEVTVNDHGSVRAIAARLVAGWPEGPEGLRAPAVPLPVTRGGLLPRLRGGWMLARPGIRAGGPS